MIFFKRFPLSKNHALSHKGSDKDKEKPKNSKQYELNFYSLGQKQLFQPDEGQNENGQIHGQYREEAVRKRLGAYKQ